MARPPTMMGPVGPPTMMPATATMMPNPAAMVCYHVVFYVVMVCGKKKSSAA